MGFLVSKPKQPPTIDLPNPPDTSNKQSEQEQQRKREEEEEQRKREEEEEQRKREEEERQWEIDEERRKNEEKEQEEEENRLREEMEREEEEREDRERLAREERALESPGRGGIIGGKTLLFEFEVNRIDFNRPDRSYRLRLTVQQGADIDDLDSIYSSVLVNTNTEWPDYVNNHMCFSDVIKQRSDDDDVDRDETGITAARPKRSEFKVNKFQFVLPKGFCMNDVRHDVTLLIEILLVQPDDLDLQETTPEQVVVGSHRFAIYPRPDIPKINVYAPPYEHMFRLTDSVTLRRTAAAQPGVNVRGGQDSYRTGGSVNTINVLEDDAERVQRRHCGTMNFTACLMEVTEDWLARWRPPANDAESAPSRVVESSLADRHHEDEEEGEDKLSGQGELPPANALERVLTDSYPYIPPDTGRRRNENYAEVPGEVPKRTLDESQINRAPSPSAVVDVHMAEVSRYREAVERCTAEILTLRTQVRDLEDSNAVLRRDLNGYSEHKLLSTEGVDDITALDKKELALKYNALVSRLARQTSELRDYRDKVLLLQKELIRKNEEEKEYLKHGQMVVPYSADVALENRLREKQQKVKVMEELCRSQEKIIKKMENLVNSKTKGELDNRHQTSLLEENSRLRKALQDLSDNQRVDKERSRGSTQVNSDHQEVLQMQERLERCEPRIRSLEKQLNDNARKWAHEKADLQLRLQEAEYGLKRAGTTGGVGFSSSPLNRYEDRGDEYNPDYNPLSSRRDPNDSRRPLPFGGKNQRLPFINSTVY